MHTIDIRFRMHLSGPGAGMFGVHPIAIAFIGATRGYVRRAFDSECMYRGQARKYRRASDSDRIYRG